MDTASARQNQNHEFGGHHGEHAIDAGIVCMCVMHAKSLSVVTGHWSGLPTHPDIVVAVDGTGGGDDGDGRCGAAAVLDKCDVL